MRDLAGAYLRPRVRGRAQLGWHISGFEAVGTFNYTDSYEDATGDRTVDYSTTFDALIEYRFADKSRPEVTSNTPHDKKTVVEPAGSARRNDWLSGLALRAGVLNIFDDAPPFASNTAGYPVGLEDPRQRFIFFGIEKKF